MKLESHIDGVWNTTEYQYRDRKILIKSRKGHGMKAHVFLKDSYKVDFTLRYSFITPIKLLDKAKHRINLTL